MWCSYCVKFKFLYHSVIISIYLFWVKKTIFLVNNLVARTHPFKWMSEQYEFVGKKSKQYEFVI
jgi:hypothetical protein